MMKRKRLFRAKAINRDNNIPRRTSYKNGDWVFGLITRLDDYGAEMTNKDGVSGIEVEPDTVGEYTGVTDKNRKLVFEDDIARVKYEGKKYVGVIQYDALGVFIFVARGFGWIPLFKLADDDMKQRNGQNLTAIEIIGNIHDNPELLEMSNE